MPSSSTVVPRLVSLATAVPDHVLHQAEVAAGSAEIFAAEYADWSRLHPVYANAEIDTRRSCVPIDWYKRAHGFGERNQRYLDNAVVLLERAASAAIAGANLQPEDIGGIVVVSSSGIATPSLDALLMERLPLRRDIHRLPVFGLGCAGGVLGLARAAQLVKAEPGMRVLLLVVELCGLTFRHSDRTKSNIIATALFGDGAAAAVLSAREPGPAIAGYGEYTWPDSLDVMGWDVRDDGLAVRFSRDIPGFVRREMRVAADRFLRRHDLQVGDVDSFVFHPGGAKVVEALEEVFDLAPGALADSRAVLREFGNMSAVTVLFVLERALRRRARRHLLSALGPGFSVGFALIEA